MEQQNNSKDRRKGIAIMGQLIGLVKPLLPIMFLAILLGVLGYLCAIFLTILAGYGILQGFFATSGFCTAGMLAAILIILAVLRGILHYGEQYCNHFIAFKLLAIIRHKVFAVLRKLCPAKLEGRDKGNLITIKGLFMNQLCNNMFLGVSNGRTKGKGHDNRYDSDFFPK